jgi:hypothetical protein
MEGERCGSNWVPANDREETDPSHGSAPNNRPLPVPACARSALGDGGGPLRKTALGDTVPVDDVAGEVTVLEVAAVLSSSFSAGWSSLTWTLG